MGENYRTSLMFYYACRNTGPIILRNDIFRNSKKSIDWIRRIVKNSGNLETIIQSENIFHAVRFPYINSGISGFGSSDFRLAIRIPEK